MMGSPVSESDQHSDRAAPGHMSVVFGSISGMVCLARFDLAPPLRFPNYDVVHGADITIG